MKAIKWLIALGLIASLAHFADNTFAIDRYPEPGFIISGFAIAVLARSRLRTDASR